MSNSADDSKKEIQMTTVGELSKGSSFEGPNGRTGYVVAVEVNGAVEVRMDGSMITSVTRADLPVRKL